MTAWAAAVVRSWREDDALLAALREVYDGATPVEVGALRDALADRGYRVVPT